MKLLRILLAISLIASSFQAPAFVSANDELEVAGLEQRGKSAEYVPDEVVVGYKNDNSPYRIEKVGNGNVQAKIEALKKNPNVKFAEPNYYAYATAVNDPYYSYQWHLHGLDQGGMNAEQAWQITRGQGVIVAVVDTGIGYMKKRNIPQAPDLVGTSFVQGFDFVNNDWEPLDDEGHGTHVAGTIAQTTNNGLGVAGVAYEASLMPVKVLDSNGSGSYTQITDGIYYAVDNGADVINMSLGGPVGTSYLEEALQYAYDAGVVVVAATGNDDGPVSYPAKYDTLVIGVGATRIDKTRAYYSNYGLEVDVVAPGGDVTVDQNNDGYGDGVLQNTFGNNPADYGYYFYQGTSMATPHVAGTAALLLAKDPTMPPLEVETALEETAMDLGPTGFDNEYGYGLIDAYAALQWDGNQVDPNNPPVADDKIVTTNEDTAVGISLTGSDEDGDLLTFGVVSGPSSGVLTGTAPNLTYTPSLNYNGFDTFTYLANDGSDDSNIATVAITVEPINDKPLADNQTVVTDEDVAVNITLTASDVDVDDTLTYSIISGPSNGVLGGTAPNVTYTPTTGYFGADSFTFKVNDGTVDSESATVSITVNPFNNPPVANDQSVETNEDTGLAITLTASDADGDSLSYSIVSGPSIGVLSGTAPNVTYTPTLNKFGQDSFTFEVNDGTVESNIAIVSIVVNAINDKPLADNQTVVTDEDVAVNITLTASDVDVDDTLTYSIVSGPSNGILGGIAPNVTYTPTAGYFGPDSFTFKVNDGTIDSNVATVTITVNEFVEPPTLTVTYDATISTTQGEAGKQYYITGTALVTVYVDGASYANATVNGRWIGSVDVSQTGITKNNGTVTFRLERTKFPMSGDPPTAAFIVEEIIINGQSYPQ